ncbi:MAG: nicotinamide mononucleotide transporter [Cryomorphaceae bacterium]|nr:nicotinamide mononucleotide transporter [Cryomorphaceae bacterium]
MSGFRLWEILAVILSLTYTILIGQGLVWCWPFAIGSGIIYTVLCFQRRIYAETFLHFFYIVMGVYGWVNWAATTENGFGQTLPFIYHLIAVPVLFGLTYLSGFLLKKHTDAKAGYVDSFTTIFSVWGTYLMVNLYIENWGFFFVINLVAVYLYFYRKMYPTALLMLVYAVLSVIGFLEWQKL